MSIGAFTDKDYKPDTSAVLEALASKKAFWDELVCFLTNSIKAKSEWKFYGRNYGWALRFKKHGKSLAALYPSFNKLTIQIILDFIQVKKALELVNSEALIDRILRTEEIHEGKWIYIEIEKETMLEDIKKMIEVRSEMEIKHE